MPQQYLRTASTAQQPSIGPAQSSKVHTVDTFVSTRVRQRKQAGMKEQVKSVAESHCTSILCFCFSSFFFVVSSLLFVRKSQQQFVFIFFQVPLALSPVTGRRLDYTIFSVDIGVTYVTKNSRLFAVTSTTRSTLLFAVFFPPIDIPQALVHHTQCPCRFVILAANAL